MHSATHPLRTNGQRGSILLVSIVLMLVAAFAVLAWLTFVTNSQRASERDRARNTAFYAAESGVEHVVDLFNHPDTFTSGETPEEYKAGGWDGHPTNYILTHPFLRPNDYSYGMFEPYLVSYDFDSNGDPLYDADGELVAVRSTYFRNLGAGDAAAISKTSKIPTCELDITSDDHLVFMDPYQHKMGWVQRIRLIHPTDIEAAEGSLPDGIRIVTKVVATGQTPTGVTIEVESLITENPTFDLKSPGAIISESSVAYNGNFNVHWGEVWSKDDVLLPANFKNSLSEYTDSGWKSGSPPEDQWFKLRAVKFIKNTGGSEYADGRFETGFSAVAPAVGTTQFTHPWDPTVADYIVKASTVKGDYRNLEQNQDLVFPDYNYSDWKSFILAYGFPYYFTDSNGVVYGVDRDPNSATYGETIGKTYDTWFNISIDSALYDKLEEKVVFVDSVPVDDAGQEGPRDANGVPVVNSIYYPRDPEAGGKMSTISFSGTSIHTRGAIFVAANMDMSGQGNPPSSEDIETVLMPDGNRPSINDKFPIFHNGLLYAWGSISSGGNRTVYGSVYAKNGYTGAGDPQVYYNYKMKNGSWLNINVSRVNRLLWDFSEVDWDSVVN